QTVYAITSLDHRAADPALLATWVRGHWSIEARLHWVRDVAFAEDHSQVRTDNGPTNLPSLRTLAINALRLTGHTNIAAGLRQHARTPLLPLVTLGLT
ncbi:MAG: ISAs1 family transposase, partial [Actinomycetota bacterium]|nr:ISAs1 family transposase [Actinomycetota bacterium]